MTSQDTQSNKAAAKAKVEYEAVKMDDGRTVDFAGKRKMLKDSVFNEDGSIAIRLDFRNGETRLFALPEALLAKFAAHGAEQKLGDETSGLEDVEDYVLAIDELTERLNAGDWSVKKENNGLAGTSILARAVQELTQKPMAEVLAMLKATNQATKLALRQDKDLAPIITRLEANKVRKPSTVNTAALLDNFKAGVATAPELPNIGTAQPE